MSNTTVLKYLIHFLIYTVYEVKKKLNNSEKKHWNLLGWMSFFEMKFNEHAYNYFSQIGAFCVEKSKLNTKTASKKEFVEAI